jgi:hypothetical protein
METTSRCQIALTILVCIYLAGCAVFKQDPLAKLAGSELPESIHVHDEWAGLSPSAPIVTDYTWTRADEIYKGKVDFAAGGYWSITYSATEEISIPAEIIKQFLAKLAECVVSTGKYTPYFDHTDDYPSINIGVVYPSKSFEFLTSSQGEKNIPWKLTIQPADEYVINSGIPSDALEILKPYLHYEILDQLIKQAQDYSNKQSP